MKKVVISVLFLGVAFAISSFKIEEKKSYKFLIQMANYEGEGAYVVVSLMNPNGDYEETLYVQGDDPDWYSDIDEWWKFYGKRRPNIDGITGATVPAGDRKVATISVDESKLDAGYKLRFETAVEEHGYHTSDIEMPLTNNLSGKIEGSGYIRYVRFMESEQ